MPPDAERQQWHPDVMRGPRVHLWRHRPEDFGAILRWYRDPELSRLTRFQVGPVADEDVLRFFNARLVASDAFAYGIHLAESGRLIGTTTFSALDPENASVLFHITIGEHDCWSQGYGTEATELMVDHAFGRLGLHRVALSVFEFNPRAVRAYEKAGFALEGRSREAVWRDGRYWDEIHMGILAPEWRARGGPTRLVGQDDTSAGRSPASRGAGSAVAGRGGTAE